MGFLARCFGTEKLDEKFGWDQFGNHLGHIWESFGVNLGYIWKDAGSRGIWKLDLVFCAPFSNKTPGAPFSFQFYEGVLMVGVTK